MQVLEDASPDSEQTQGTITTHLHLQTGQPIPGPSQDDPQQHAGFDRFYSLMEVCASTPPMTLNPQNSHQHRESLPHHPFPHLSLAPMVRAPPSDIENDLHLNPSSLVHTEYPPALPRNCRDEVKTGKHRHACKMCNKTFDRPSTLKTHLLVHTGITPFSCHLCGRRFGVQSNCNRHIRRCALREQLFLTRRLEFEAAQSGQPYSPPHSPARSGSNPPPPVPPKPKRPRRKRSPEAAWIPQSLAAFTLTTACAPAPVPLPPVRPRTEQEERDSYILCHGQPYTDEGWSGRLPGPAPLFDSMTKNSGSPRRRNISRK